MQVLSQCVAVYTMPAGQSGSSRDSKNLRRHGWRCGREGYTTHTDRVEISLPENIDTLGVKSLYLSLYGFITREETH